MTSLRRGSSGREGRCAAGSIRILGEPGGERAGFFVGDGVGLGKGRELAGVVLENYRRGRKRHLWVSVVAVCMRMLVNCKVRKLRSFLLKKILSPLL